MRIRAFAAVLLCASAVLCCVFAAFERAFIMSLAAFKKGNSKETKTSKNVESDKSDKEYERYAADRAEERRKMLKNLKNAGKCEMQKI